MTLCLWTAAILFITVIECEGISEEKEAKYQEIFEVHQQWEGHYQFNKTLYYSMLIVHSYNKHTDGVIATFKDVLGATIDVRGEQLGESELSVTFTTETVFKDVNRFPGNFSFSGELSQRNDRWFFKGSVKVPANGLFGEVEYQPSDGDIGPFFDDDKSLAWRYTLIIGVPILLALVGVAGTVGIIYWAIKKGYIRHVPKSYDSFDNPVQFDRNKQTVHM